MSGLCGRRCVNCCFCTSTLCGFTYLFPAACSVLSALFGRANPAPLFFTDGERQTWTGTSISFCKIRIYGHRIFFIFRINDVIYYIDGTVFSPLDLRWSLNEKESDDTWSGLLNRVLIIDDEKRHPMAEVLTAHWTGSLQKHIILQLTMRTHTRLLLSLSPSINNAYLSQK